MNWFFFLEKRLTSTTTAELFEKAPPLLLLSWQLSTNGLSGKGDQRGRKTTPISGPYREQSMSKKINRYFVTSTFLATPRFLRVPTCIRLQHYMKPVLDFRFIICIPHMYNNTYIGIRICKKKGRSHALEHFTFSDPSFFSKWKPLSDSDREGGERGLWRERERREGRLTESNSLWRERERRSECEEGC